MEATAEVYYHNLLFLSAVAAGRAEGRFPAERYYYGINPFSTQRGRAQYMRTLVETNRDTLLVAWAALTKEQKRDIEKDDMFTYLPQPRASAGRIRVVPCGFVDRKTGQFVAAEDLGAWADELDRAQVRGEATKLVAAGSYFTPKAKKKRPEFGDGAVYRAPKKGKRKAG